MHALLLCGLQARRHVLYRGEDGLCAGPPRVPAASAALAAPAPPVSPATPVLTVSLLLEGKHFKVGVFWGQISFIFRARMNLKYCDCLKTLLLEITP